MTAVTRLWPTRLLALGTDGRIIHDARCGMIRPFFTVAPDFGERYAKWLASLPRVIHVTNPRFCKSCLPVSVNGSPSRADATREENLELRRRFENGESMAALAVEVGISRTRTYQRLRSVGADTSRSRKAQSDRPPIPMYDDI